MGWLADLFGLGKPRRRRGPARRVSGRPVAPRRRVAASRSGQSAQQRERRALDAQAARWVAADDRKRKTAERTAREREQRAVLRDQRAEDAMNRRQYRAAQKLHDRGVAAYIKWGMTRAEAEDMIARGSDPDLGRENPLPLILVKLGREIAVGRLLYPSPRRRNPAHLHAAVSDPRLREMSAEFHGSGAPNETIVLDSDQRRAPPREVVLLGRELSVEYAPDAHSERRGSWSHASGEMLDGSKRSGRRLVVADAAGRVYTVPGKSGMRFKPSIGLEG